MRKSFISERTGNIYTTCNLKNYLTLLYLSSGHSSIDYYHSAIFDSLQSCTGALETTRKKRNAVTSNETFIVETSIRIGRRPGNVFYVFFYIYIHYFVFLSSQLLIYFIIIILLLLLYFFYNYYYYYYYYFMIIIIFFL